MMARARDRMRVRGFTLLEVLVALVIVAFGMGAVLAALSGAAVNVGALRDKTLAQWIALNRLADVRLNLQPPQVGTTQGDIKGFGNADWHWQQIVTSMQEIPGLQQITVSVRRNPGSSSGAGSSSNSPRATSVTSANSSSGANATPWTTTVIGFRGDALAAASGDVPGDWGSANPGAPNTNGTGSSSSSGANTGTVPNPGTTMAPGLPPPGAPPTQGPSSSGGP